MRRANKTGTDMENQAVTTRGEQPSLNFSVKNRQLQTVAQAMNTNTLKAYEQRFGSVAMEMRIGVVLFEANELLGAGMDPNALKAMSRMLMNDFPGCPAGCFIMAVKEGVKTQTIGHKLTYPILCQWMHEQDARVEEHNFNQYLSHK